ncbi:hypothetical protein HAX54_043104, partial [Datura stramonium]|nr:hypothetical protein [Datura stramonium]
MVDGTDGKMMRRIEEWVGRMVVSRSEKRSSDRWVLVVFRPALGDSGKTMVWCGSGEEEKMDSVGVVGFYRWPETVGAWWPREEEKEKKRREGDVGAEVRGKERVWGGNVGCFP